MRSPGPSPLSRRSFLAAATGALALTGGSLRGAQDRTGRTVRLERPRPTPAQLAWQEDELALFLHFGMNTFTGREWGDGTEDPALFRPTDLDARSWAREARAAGFRAMILTAKHHDGFCLWPTRTTAHSVASSPWRGGAGDVVGEFMDACRAEGLRPGLYCSAWDRNAPSYGDSPRYNDLYVEQLTELLTAYGPIHEVWFDGAGGEDARGRRQRYDWPRYWSVVRRLQPGAVIFSDAGPDVRWIGNEAGWAGDPNWSTVDPEAVPFPGATGEAVLHQLQHGDPDGTAWRPGETDVSIRPGWFHRPEEDGRVRSVRNLVDLFFTSVGRNSKLLLNVPPTAAGRLHDTDVQRIRGLHHELTTLFADDVASGGARSRRLTGRRTALQEIDLGRTTEVGLVDLREAVRNGQSVAGHRLEGLVEGAWRTVALGLTVGHRRLHSFPPVPVRHLRLHVRDRWGSPPPVRVGLFEGR